MTGKRQPQVMLSIRIPKQLRRDLDRASKLTNRGRSDFIRIVLEDAVGKAIAAPEPTK